MKCPKCGYTSFDYLKACKKCGADLASARGALGVIAISPEEMAVAAPRAQQTITPHDEPHVEEMIEMTSFEETAPADLGGQDFDSFDSLVEPTSYTAAEHTSEPDIFAEPTAPPQAAPKAPEPPSKAAKDEDEEFLDLDFGGIFEEEKK